MPMVNPPFPVVSQDHRSTDALAAPSRRRMQVPSAARDAGVVLALATIVALAEKLLS